jgi:hypothetical protein
MSIASGNRKCLIKLIKLKHSFKLLSPTVDFLQGQPIRGQILRTRK